MNDNTAEQLKCREAFEREITAPPYELSVSSYPDNDTSAWPGNYRDYKVELAWCMFQSAWNTHQVDPNFPDEIEELKLTLVEVTEERDHLRSVMESTRADSGEAVAWQFRNVTEEGPSPVWHDIDKSKFDVLRNDPHAEVRELFTHPSATPTDVRDTPEYNYGYQQALEDTRHDRSRVVNPSWACCDYPNCPNIGCTCESRATALDVRAIETLVTRWLGMMLKCTGDEVGSSKASVFYYCAHDLRVALSQRVEKGNATEVGL